MIGEHKRALADTVSTLEVRYDELRGQNSIIERCSKNVTYQIKEQFFDVELFEIDDLFFVLALFDYAESLLHGGLLLLLPLLGWWLISVRIKPRNGRCWSLLLEHETCIYRMFILIKNQDI